MSLSVAELKKVSVASIRDISAGLRAKAASLRATQAGVTDLPHKGTWTGIAADNADHEIGTFAKGVGRDAEAYQDVARKVDRAGDEFEGLKQLLAKLENEAAGKFSINEATGEVTPLTKDFNKADRDYIAATIKQLCAAGGQANDDLAAGIHATDASGATSPADAAGGGPLALTPNSSIKPDGVVGGMQNLVAPNPEGDPGATKAAAATAGGTDTINYKELYPKTTVDGHQLGSVGAVPGVGNIDKTKPAKLAPTLADRDVPAFKDLTRQNLINAKVPADQIEQRVNDAVKAAQAPHFVPDADPMRTPGQVPLHNSPGDQFNDIVGRANDEATKTIDGQIEQAKILTGQAGPGAPGVAEAWKEVGLGAVRQVHELTSDPLAAPKMGIEQAKEFYNHPGEFIGKNVILGTEALAGGAVGGEAAAGARGLLGDLTGTEGRALTHGLDDAAPGHHAPPLEHPTLTGGDHTPSVSDHHALSTDSWSGHSAFDSSGQISSELRDQIVSIEKGDRPDPATYLPREYIEQHLEQFDKGVARFMTDENLDSFGIGQRDGTSFVMPKGEADALMNATRGDPRAMEDALGLPEGFLDKNRIVRVDIEDPRSYDLRMPSGNEAGANSQWIPGGRLPGGESEAIIDGGRVPREDYKISDIPGR
ncbi:WXG100 family type VII secretion target [Mycobacteroides abscessus]|uniref:WXG100 family type VII secretion target n=1 Tax=Mycobacteroides abscessus TaxID=36809 RepID=UPI001F3E820D|nr:WXG100 family type VII secretion target [Mycobacteroides abscessus]